MIIFQKDFIQDILNYWTKIMSGGGLVYIVGILFLYVTLDFIIGNFILNALCIYLLNVITYTKKFINFRFILGEFVGGFVGYIIGGFLYRGYRVLDFDITLFVLFAFVSSFVLLVFNMLLLIMRYRVFEKSRYESLLSSHSKKLWLRKSFVFGLYFSSLLNCIWIILFAMWLQ